MKFLLFIIITLVAIKTAQTLSKIRIKNGWFVDETDRVVLFHGINSVQKDFPWVPDQRAHLNLTNTTQLRLFKEWGFNVVRLGWMWSGVYPTAPDIVNLTYINKMMDIIDTLQEFGMYVIIDMHQDMLSSKFYSYDGAPRWIIDQLPPSKHDYPWPFKKDYIGFAAYATEACGFAFQCLYDNKNNFQDYFNQFWATTANALKHNPSVLAYEFINEPWAGDVYADPLLFLPGEAGRKNLMPLYDRAYEAIRQFDNETIVFYEPVTWGVMSNGTVFGTGFDHAPGNDPNRTALSWHYYCWLLNFDTDPIRNDTMPVFVKQLCDSLQLELYFKTVEEDIKRLGAVSFLTEFGVCIYRDPVTGHINLDECKAAMDGADEHLVSWAYWDSDFFTDQFEINSDVVNAFSRVYPMATNGIPKLLSYNSTTRIFKYSYDINTRVISSTATEIFIPKILYPHGFVVQTSPELKWSFDDDSSKLIVVIDKQALKKLSTNFENGEKKDTKTLSILIYPRN